MRSCHNSRRRNELLQLAMRSNVACDLDQIIPRLGVCTCWLEPVASYSAPYLDICAVAKHRWLILPLFQATLGSRFLLRWFGFHHCI